MLEIKMSPVRSVRINRDEYMDTYFIDGFVVLVSVSDDCIRASISQKSQRKVKAKVANKVISKLFGTKVSIQSVGGINSHVSHYDVFAVQ